MRTEQIPSTWRIDRRKDGIAVFDETGQARCGARKSTDGQACHKFPMDGLYRCLKHRGPGLVGEAHPNYKDGKQARLRDYLPPRLQERFQRFLADDSLADLHETLALMELRLSELASRIDIGEFGAGYNSLRSLHHRAQGEFAILNNAQADKEKRAKALENFLNNFNQMGELIQTGQKDYATWQQILQVSAEKRTTAKTIADIEYKGENSVPLIQIQALVWAIGDLFKRVNAIEDGEKRQREFASGIGRLQIVKGDE